MDIADIRPSIYTWAVVGVMALTFIVLGKYLTQRWPIPGLTALFASA